MTRLRNTWTILSNLKVCRAAPILGAFLLLGGCDATLGGGDAASIGAMIKNMWSGSANKVALEEAAAVPYASMGIRLGGGPETMLILAGDTGGQRLWTSAVGIAITTSDDGRIVRTAGFAHNLEGYARGRDSLGEGGVRSLRWQADFPDLKLYSVSIACRDRPAGDETIIILGKDIHTRRIDESCSTEGSGLDWSFKNRYWLDPSSGLVWRSIQHVHPRLDAIETETLRPPF